jgi:tRNA-2-methylthio-N6-dimethylallyladenosine synthase
MRDLSKVCRHLHLPVQSGSTRVLKAMRRRHSREEYLALVEKLKTTLPDLQLSTDMIVGFPGETDDDFRETLSLTEAVGYHSMFSFKYSPRPNTLAAQRMPDDVAEAEKTRRIVELQSLQKGIQARLHEASIGRTVDVLVDTTSKRRAWELAGRTSGNTVVNFPGESSWLGTFVPVRIERAGAFGVWGQPILAAGPATEVTTC